MVLLALLIAMVPAFASVAPAQGQQVTCYGDYCSGLDPIASGCAADAYTVASVAQDIGGGVTELRYSPTCGTNWARWTQYPTGLCLNCTIVALRAVQDTGYTQSMEVSAAGIDPGESVWTAMIYSPVRKVAAEAMKPCGDSGLIATAFDCAISGWDSTGAY